MVGGTAGYMQAQPDIWWGGVVCLIIVSTPGPGFVMIKARFGQVDDEVGHALFGQVGDQVGQFGQGQGQETMVTMGLFDYSVYSWPRFSHDQG